MPFESFESRIINQSAIKHPRSKISMVRIRPYSVADAQAVWDAAIESGAELLPWMPWFHAGYHLRETRSWLEMQVAAFRLGTSYEFAIESDERRYLGGCGINQIDPLNRRANLGYWVRTSETGRGVATEAARLTAEWAFTHTDLVRLEIVAATENAASQRVAERAGAHREGVLRSRLFARGQFQDAVVYSLVKPHA
jgi:RimJ/RimL family protein N-acetyltransferase